MNTQPAAPARTVDADGTTSFLLDGMLHREGSFAVECEDGTREWWVGGKRHREDGPAIEYPDGSRRYYLVDVCLSEALFAAITELPPEPRRVALALLPDCAARDDVERIVDVARLLDESSAAP